MGQRTLYVYVKVTPTKNIQQYDSLDGKLIIHIVKSYPHHDETDF